MIYNPDKPESPVMLNLALHVMYVALENKVRTIVDLGSHQGHLLFQLSRLTENVTLIGYEAILENCIKGRSLGARAVINHNTIVPDGVVISELHVPSDNWTGSLAASIYSLTATDKMVPAGPNIEISTLCKALSTLKDWMLKINIEGVDVATVEALLDTGVKPSALVFELMPGDAVIAAELFARLSKWYYVPSDLKHAGCVSYCFGSNSGWVKTLTPNKNGLFRTFRRS